MIQWEFVTLVLCAKFQYNWKTEMNLIAKQDILDINMSSKWMPYIATPLEYTFWHIATLEVVHHFVTWFN